VSADDPKPAGAWVELQVELPAEAAEIVAATLSELLGGVELRDAETVFPTAPDRAAVVALCTPDRLAEVLAAIDELLATARAAGAAVDPVTVRQRPAHEDEWRDVWKQFFRTTRIGARFVVRPSWDLAPVPAGAEVIELDPGRAFGTGAHPSTRLVIGALERLAAGGHAVEHFLDLGCGSGILAIAAARLWPAAAGLALDLDPEAAACTRENLARNQVTTVVAETGAVDDAAPTRPFDLVMANIQRDVLEGLAGRLHAVLARHGRLVLSGLLTSDVAPVRVVYERVGFAVLAQDEEGEWGSLLLQPAAS
jgi:ribosomal protein L11 methyltransferase